MQIAGYTILEQLSQGAISTVFLARQDALERLVLIKNLNSQWQQEGDLRERFRREAIICARMRHPNIVDIIDVSTRPDQLYLIQEYIKGTDLEKLIRAGHPLPLPVILFISKSIFKGLAYAHGSGIIHRDIKPSNIMAGINGQVKIADFGLARVDDLPGITVHGEVVGTPAYMSPEQARVSKLSQQTDIFSLGATLYQLAANIVPFQGESIVESIQKVIRFHPEGLQKVRSDIPKWYADLVDQMLSKTAAERPQKLAEILKIRQIADIPAEPPPGFIDIVNNLQGNDRTARQTPPAIRITSAEPAGKSRGTIMLMVLLAAIFAGIVFAWQYNQTPASAAASPAQIVDSISIADNENTLAADDRSGPDTLQADAGNQTTVNPVDQQRMSNTPQKSATAGGNREQLPVNAPPPETPAGSSSQQPDNRVAADTLPVQAPTAFLQVACKPWAEIFIDGRYIDTTPLKKPLQLPPGQHILELRHPQFPSRRESVNLQAGRLDSLVVVFKAAEGHLDIAVIPWAKIFIDGRYIETTPLQKPLTLSPGKYLLRLENPVYANWQDSISIRTNQTLTKTIRLTR